MISAPDCPLVGELCPSPNFGPRKGGAGPSILLLHYTGVETAAKAIAWLANPASEVSCHYVVDEAGRITQMVAEDKRAWHAGAAFWAGDTDINSCSIGIEIQNPGHAAGSPPYPSPQIAAVIALSRDIVARHGIRPERVLAHSDVAPARKIDPGEFFPWAELATARVGHWVEPEPLVPGDVGLGLGAIGGHVDDIRRKLADYGYGIAETGEFDLAMDFVVRAFQRHFRPARVDGRLDRSTIATLDALRAALPANAPLS